VTEIKHQIFCGAIKLKKVLCIGSLNIDNVYQVNHINKPGETQTALSMGIYPGGKGLNQSIALAKAGAKIYLAGMVGADGDFLLSTGKGFGVDTGLIQKLDGKSGHSIIQVDEKGQNSIVIYGGTNACLSFEFIDSVIDRFSPGDYLLLQNEVNNLPYIIERAHQKRLYIVLNPSPFTSALYECDLQNVSLFILNEIEGEQLTHETETETMISVLREKYAKAEFVLTLGEKGSVYFDKDRIIRQNAYKAEVIDTTAAGDTFTGYFISNLLLDKDIQYSLNLASRASALSVSRKGAASSIPELHEVLDMGISFKNTAHTIC
jgi:ribokinase